MLKLIILGLVLLFLGLILDIGLLVTVGIILAVIGAIVYAIAALTGRALFGRKKHLF